MKRRLLEILVCPVSKGPLRREGDELVSAEGRRYPIVNGIPVMIPGKSTLANNQGDPLV
jgi:uncharacterized protein YbaR (Trm112 family)